MFKNKMITEGIPERVYALCCLLKEGPLKLKDVKEMMEPEYLKPDKKSDEYFGKFKNVAIELDLIIEQEGNLILNVEKSVFDSFDSFRIYIIKNLYKYREGNFYKTTNTIYNLNVDFIKAGIKSISEKEMLDMLEKSFDRLDVKEIRGWRFWASFLGFGNTYGDDGMCFIPNSFTYLKNVIYLSTLKTEEIMTLSDFLNLINKDIQIICDVKSKELNFGFSNGLRMLHDLGYIELSYSMDSSDYYKLYPMELHAFGNNVSHITIKGGKIWI